MKSNQVEIPVKRRVAKSAYYILSTSFFERYSTAAISSVLVLFINVKLGYDKDASTAIYHAYEFSTFIFAIVGAIIADSFLGLYKTMVASSMICAAGSILIAIGVIDALYLPIQAFSIGGLVVIAVGAGCLKPLGSAYGAQQYGATEVNSIALFFALDYIMSNCGSITSRFVNPILRQDVKCFGNQDCFALAFGTPGILMVILSLLVMIANRYSETLQANGTTLLSVFACIWYAIVMKIKSRECINPSKSHWLDYSEVKYGKILVSETKVLLNVLVLYVPISLFWALFLQQGSRWVFQAVRMNGDLGFYTIKPDQFSVINPLLVVILIPMFECFVNPLLSKVGIGTALRKITLGGVLAGVAMVISAIVESQIDYKHLHMIWLFPQYLVMTIGEILVVIPLMNFSYSEAPKSMKAVFQAMRLLTMGLGHLIVVVVAASKLMDSQIHEFILFAGLMFLDMIIFAILARRYKPLKLIGDEHRIKNEVDDILLKA